MVDLCSSHEAHIDIAALQQQQHVCAAEHHVRALGAPLVVGRRRKLPGLHECANNAALKKDREAWTMQPLSKRRRKEGNADPREYNLPVLKLARAQIASISEAVQGWLSVIVDAASLVGGLSRPSRPISDRKSVHVFGS